MAALQLVFSPSCYRYILHVCVCVSQSYYEHTPRAEQPTTKHRNNMPFEVLFVVRLSQLIVVRIDDGHAAMIAVYTKCFPSSNYQAD